MNIKVLLTSLVLAAFIPDGVGTTMAKGKLHITHKSDQATNKYLIPESFNTELSTLPVGYTGENIDALYKHLSQLIPPKDEFEKTEAYLQRLNTNTPKQLFAFLNNSYDVFNSLTYNPDSETVTVSINQLGCIVGSPSIEIKNITSSVEKYKTRNKFGANFVATSYTIFDYAIYPVNYYSIRDICFKINTDEARDLKQNYGILYICKITPSNPTPHNRKSQQISWSNSDMTYSDATFSRPDRHINFIFSINITLYQIWVFNKKTGIIYAKDVIAPLL